MAEDTRQYLRRNFILGVANGVIFMTGSALLSPTTLLPQFLSGIFKSEALIGLGANIIMMGWNLPQVVAAYFFRSLPHRKPVYMVGNILRMTFTGAFVLSLYLFHSHPLVVGWLFFACFTLAGLASGTVGLAYSDIVARTIPANRRGAYNAFRIVGGQGIGALAGGFFIEYILSHPETFPYPLNYVTIFGIAWFMMTVGVTAFSFVKEPVDTTVRPRKRLRAYIIELYLMVRGNDNYRRFLVQKIFRACELFASAYYVLYATRVLGLGAEVAGTFQIIGLATTFGAAILWGMMSDRHGNRRVVFISTLCAAAAPVYALVVALFMPWQGPAGGGAQTVAAPTGLVTLLMAPIFVLMAVAGVGGMIGFQNYIMDSAPHRRRPLYLGLTTTLDGVLLIIFPTIGGFVIRTVNLLAGSESAGYLVTFVLTGAFIAVAAVLAQRLEEPRQEVIAEIAAAE